MRLRRGPPHSFGWLKVDHCTLDDGAIFNLWEIPSGDRLYIGRGMWVEIDDQGLISAIEPPVTHPFRHA